MSNLLSSDIKDNLLAINLPNGETFDLLDIKPERVSAEAVAHVLSNQCRYGGACNFFYSVAEHSVLLSEYIERAIGDIRLAADALVHDVSESVLVDIPRPLKRFLPEYLKIEKPVESSLRTRFGLTPEIDPLVDKYDKLIPYTECTYVFPELLHRFNHSEVLEGVVVEGWTPKQASEKFLDRFYYLYNKKESGLIL